MNGKQKVKVTLLVVGASSIGALLVSFLGYGGPKYGNFDVGGELFVYGLLMLAFTVLVWRLTLTKHGAWRM